MINLELAKKHQETFEQTMMLAEHMMRPYSRKYDKEEQIYPKEMEDAAAFISGGRSEAMGGGGKIKGHLKDLSGGATSMVVAAGQGHPTRRTRLALGNEHRSGQRRLQLLQRQGGR